MKFFYLFLLPFSLYSQINSGRVSRDFNQDGKVDTLIYYKEFNSQELNVLISLKLDNGDVFDYKKSFSYGSFLNKVNLEEEIYPFNNQYFIDELMKIISPNINCENLDFLSNFLINIERTQSYCYNSVIDYKYEFNPEFLDEFPKSHNYYSKIFGNQILICNGSNLKFEKYNSDSSILIYNHAVFMKKVNKYCCVFINDQNITFGHKKLRWPSILEVEESNGYIIILQKVYDDLNYIYFSDPKNGKLFRINPLVFDNKLYDHFEVKDNKLKVFYRGLEIGEKEISTILNSFE